MTDYQRKWYKANKEKQKAYSREYYRQHKKPLTDDEREKKRKYSSDYYHKHKPVLTDEQQEKRREYAIAYREAHRTAPRINPNRKSRGYWTKDRIKATTEGHTTYAAWYNSCSTAAQTALKNGWTEEIAGHLLRVEHKLKKIESLPEESAVCHDYRPLLTRIAARYVPPADVDDVVSDSVIQGMLYFDKFDPTKGSLATWLGMICRNNALKFYNKNTITTEYIGDMDVPDEEEPKDYTVTDINYSRALALIDSDDELRRLNLTDEFVEYFTGGVRLEGLADRLGINIRTLQGFFTSAKNRLRKKMEYARH